MAVSTHYKRARGYFENITNKESLPGKEATILLIGSTGMGKSTLGNYLLDPNGQKKYFSTAKGNKPETQHTQIGQATFTGHAIEALQLQYSSVKLTVIDTPGLNESDAADLKHMIGIVEQLEEQSEIAACIVVVKFNAKIDAQYKKTIEYYSRLLPSLFEKNVFVVMTDYATDPRSVAMRERQGINVDQIVETTAQEIVHSAKLSYGNLMVFQLDCLPFNPEEITYSEDVRNSIFEYIMQLQPIALANLKVAKTERLLQMDKERIKKYEGEIDGYKERLIELNQHSKITLDTIQKIESNVAQCCAKIDAIERELEEKDTPDLVTAVSWSVDTRWKFLTTQKQGCELKSKWKIVKVRQWTNGKCDWGEVQVTDHTFKGKVKGKFSRGLYANVILETEKHTKYATEIHQLKQELEIAKSNLESEENHLSAYREKEKKYEEDIATFEKFIQEKRVKIKMLEATRVTIPEARKRLDSITA